MFQMLHPDELRFSHTGINWRRSNVILLLYSTFNTFYTVVVFLVFVMLRLVILLLMVTSLSHPPPYNGTRQSQQNYGLNARWIASNWLTRHAADRRTNVDTNRDALFTTIEISLSERLKHSSAGALSDWWIAAMTDQLQRGVRVIWTLCSLLWVPREFWCDVISHLNIIRISPK